MRTLLAILPSVGVYRLHVPRYPRRGKAFRNRCGTKTHEQTQAGGKLAHEHLSFTIYCENLVITNFRIGPANNPLKLNMLNAKRGEKYVVQKQSVFQSDLGFQ